MLSVSLLRKRFWSSHLSLAPTLLLSGFWALRTLVAMNLLLTGWCFPAAYMVTRSIAVSMFVIPREKRSRTRWTACGRFVEWTSVFCKGVRLMPLTSGTDGPPNRMEFQQCRPPKACRHIGERRETYYDREECKARWRETANMSTKSSS